MHRLHVQGVRAIIDNTDTGIGVLPINSSSYYQGFWSCLKSIEESEGTSGLYKGIGCTFMKFSLLYGGILLAHEVAKKFLLDNKRAHSFDEPARNSRNNPVEMTFSQTEH